MTIPIPTYTYRHVKFQFFQFFLLSPSPLTFSDDPHVYSLINLHCNFDEAMRCIPQPTRPPAFNLIT